MNNFKSIKSNSILSNIPTTKNFTLKLQIKKVIHLFHEQFYKDGNNVIKNDYKSDVGLFLNFKKNNEGNAFLTFNEPDNNYVIKLNIKKFIGVDGELLNEKLLKTLNHEYLHYIDYKANELNNKDVAFSEDLNKKKDDAIKNFQRSILSGKLYKKDNNKYDIKTFDKAILTSLLTSCLKIKNLKLNEDELIHIHDKYLSSFSKLLNNLEENIFIYFGKSDNSIDLTMEYVKSFFKDDKSLNVFVKNLSDYFVKNKNENIEKLLKNEMFGEYFNEKLVEENFSHVISSTSPFYKSRMTVLHLRNLFYTRTLDYYNESPNVNYLKVFNGNSNSPLYYTGQASEKLSFSGDNNANLFVREYFDLVINKNKKIIFPNIKNEVDGIEENLSKMLEYNLIKFIEKYDIPKELDKKNLMKL